MSGNFKLDDYVDVAQRIKDFAAKYPDGSLQSDLRFVEELGGWLCRASAFRTPDDPRPGIGHAFEQVPGKTPYTKDSEAMNAETSAWGRAIVALGFDTKKIASRQEVQARSNGHGDGNPDPHGLQASRADAVQPGQVIVPFGKHKGKTVQEVPASYWDWWLAQDGNKNPEVLAAVELHLGLTTAAPVDDDLDLPF